MKLPISAIIVGLNEAIHLEKCMPPLAFCDEILYFDLGSTDNSREIAIDYGAIVINHDRVDTCEWIHTKYANTTKHNWILITDPDEVISQELIADIFNLFHGNKLVEENIGAVTAPWVFYFKNRKLEGTNWGGINRRILLANNKYFEFSPLVHVGRNVRDDYEIYEIEFNGKNYIHHFWMTSYAKLLEKHARYLRNEGEARYKTGRRATIKEILKEPFKSFKYSFWHRKGYKDGVTGLFLSIFWAWYESSAKLKNYSYQRKATNKSL